MVDIKRIEQVEWRSELLTKNNEMIDRINELSKIVEQLSDHTHTVTMPNYPTTKQTSGPLVHE